MKTETVTLAGVSLTFLSLHVGPKESRKRVTVVFHENRAYRLHPIPPGDLGSLVYAHEATIFDAAFRVYVASKESPTAKALAGQVIVGPFGAVAALESGDLRCALRRAPTMDKLLPGEGGRRTFPVHVSIGLYHQIKETASARGWTIGETASAAVEAGLKILSKEAPTQAPTPEVRNGRARA